MLAGFVATLVDEEDFPSFADGVWWAIVTLATVGYGDIVPTTSWGRVVGSALIIFGVTFLSFLTAIVTSLFISTDQEQQRAKERALQEASEARYAHSSSSAMSVWPRSGEAGALNGRR
jgi:voltage-gated potassium channel